MTDVPHNLSSQITSPQSYSVPPEEISASEIAKIEQKFWATDTQSPYASTYKLDASEMKALVPERPVMPKPTEETVTAPPWYNKEATEQSFEPKFTESAFPSLMETEQNELIQEMGKEQGMPDEEIAHMKYYNSHRELLQAQDPSIAEFLATIDERALKNLTKDFPNAIPKEPKAQPNPHARDKADSELYSSNFEKQIENLSEDEKTAHRYAFYYGDKASPKMQQSVKAMQSQALTATRKEAGIPPGITPALDTYPIDDELSFHFKQEYEAALESSGLNAEEKNRARFLTYQGEFLNQIVPQERSSYLAVSEVNNRLTNDIKENMKTRFQLPQDWSLSPLYQSSYNAKLSEEFFHEAVKKVGTFAEKPIDPATGESMPKLTTQQMGQIQYAMIRPNDPTINTKLSEIAALLSAQIIPQVQAKFSLPTNFIPPLGSLDPLVALSPLSIRTHQLIAATESDLETMYALAEEEPQSAEKSMFMDWIARVSIALTEMKQSLYEMQADDSDKAKEFTLMNAQTRIELLEAEQLRMEEARRKAKKKMGPLTFITKQVTRYTIGELVILTGATDKKSFNRALNDSLVVYIALDKHVVVPTLDAVGSIFEGVTYVINETVQAVKFILMHSLLTEMLTKLPGVNKSDLKQAMEVIAMAIVMAAMTAAILLVPGVGLAMAAQLAFSLMGPMIISEVLIAAGVPETYAMIAAVAFTMVSIGAYNVHAARQAAATAAAAAPPSGATAGVRITTAAPPIPPPAPPPAPAATRAGRAVQEVQNWGRQKAKALQTWYDDLIKLSSDYSKAQTKYSAAEKAGSVSDDIKQSLYTAKEAYKQQIKPILNATQKVHAVSTVTTATAEAYKMKVRAEQILILGEMDQFIETLRIMINMLTETISRMYSDMSAESSFGHRAGNIQNQLDEYWRGLSQAGSRLHHAQA